MEWVAGQLIADMWSSGELNGETHVKKGVVAWRRERMGDTRCDVFLSHPNMATKNMYRLWIIGWRSWISYNNILYPF
jgi:hypothetical protein